MNSRNHNNIFENRRSAKTTVYFIPASSLHKPDKDVLALNTVLEHQVFNLLSSFRKHGIIGVKLCEHHPQHSAAYGHAFVSLLKQNELSGFICNTSNRHINYKDNGIANAYTTIKICDKAHDAIPFMAIDGIYGEHEISRKSHRLLKDNVYLAGELPNLDGLISVCCFDCSDQSNISSSIVNLGQGLASKKGKIYQRTTSCPQVNVHKCYACRRCVRECPSNAISIEDEHVVISKRKCIKCGKCVEIAHYGGITYDWNASIEHYDQSVTLHAKGVLALLNKKTLCVNIITRNNENDTSFVGAMISKDPVAADTATIDLCESRQLFSSSQLQRCRRQVDFAYTAGVGSIKHNIATVAY